jgi:hypothetical protein
MQIRRNWIWVIALALAWIFDFLFWKQEPGISFFLFVVLCLIGGGVAATLSGIRPDVKSLILAGMILASACITFLRSESFTVGCAVMLTLGLLALLATTYRGGKWPLYGVIDYLAGWAQLGLNMALHPALLPPEKVAEGTPPPTSAWRRWLPPVLRGLLISIPVLLLFSALLASADAVFGKWIGMLFRLENLPEYIFRLTYILIGAYLLTGVFLHAILASREEKISLANPPRVKPFLGFLEAAIVLGGTNLLFLAFVGFQFRYFFGGAQNIGVEGFTYSEYARSGFGELIAVACISLLMLLTLGSITQREQRPQRITFTALGVGLVALVSVILISAFQRLLLYEAAYGFTGLRIYTHVFMAWLGILLIAVIALEVAGRMRLFPLASLLAALGFVLSLAILNVDGVIVDWNSSRALAGHELDSEYLTTLSDDAVPALMTLYRSGPAAERDTVGAGLSCRLWNMQHETARSWQSFQLARFQARQLLEASDLSTKYPVQQNDRGITAGTVPCSWGYRTMD